MLYSIIILYSFFFLRDETFQRNLLQKKLNQKKLLKEDLNKLLDLSDTERNKNKVPGSYVSLVIMKSYH